MKDVFTFLALAAVILVALLLWDRWRSRPKGIDDSDWPDRGG